MVATLKIAGRYARLHFLEVSSEKLREVINNGVDQEAFEDDCIAIGGVVSGWIELDDQEVGTVTIEPHILQAASITKASGNFVISEEHGTFASDEIEIDGDYDPSKLFYDVERLEVLGEVHEVFTVNYDGAEIEFGWSDPQVSQVRAISSDGSQQEIEFREEEYDDDEEEDE
jgi:hypothetical protein